MNDSSCCRNQTMAGGAPGPGHHEWSPLQRPLCPLPGHLGQGPVSIHLLPLNFYFICLDLVVYGSILPSLGKFNTSLLWNHKRTASSVLSFCSIDQRFTVTLFANIPTLLYYCSWIALIQLSKNLYSSTYLAADSVADPDLGSGAVLSLWPLDRERFFPDPGSQTYICESLVTTVFVG